jgi:opacity protein-like surface antigen
VNPSPRRLVAAARVLARALVPALAAVLAATTASPAAAQNFAPSGKLLSFGLGGGVTVPIDDARSAFDSGINGHGFVRLNLPVFPIQPRLDFTFQKLDIKDIAFVDPALGVGGTYSEGEQSVFSGLAQAQVALIRAGPIQPYLVAGVGLASMKTKLEGDPGTDNVSQSATKLTVNGGAGLNVKLGPISGFVEGRLDNIVNDGELMNFDSVQLVPVSFGLVF